MAKMYGVLSAGRGRGEARRSLTSDDYITVDVAFKRRNGDNVTLRLFVQDGEVALAQFNGRWAEALKAHGRDWKVLVNIRESEASRETGR